MVKEYKQKVKELKQRFQLQKKAQIEEKGTFQDEVVEIKQTILLNELNTQKERKEDLINEGIRKNMLKIEKNLIEIRLATKDLELYELRLGVFRFKLKEIYLFLIKDPENLM